MPRQQMPRPRIVMDEGLRQVLRSLEPSKDDAMHHCTRVDPATIGTYGKRRKRGSRTDNSLVRRPDRSDEVSDDPYVQSVLATRRLMRSRRALRH